MHEYTSKPHNIKAFKFEKGTITPDWFNEAREKMLVSITLGYKDQNYITIYNKDGGYNKAYFGDWVCINEQGTIFKLTNNEFIACFAPSTDL